MENNRLLNTNGLIEQRRKYKNSSSGLTTHNLQIIFSNTNYTLISAVGYIEDGRSVITYSKIKSTSQFESYSKIYDGNMGYEREFFALAIGY